MNTTSQKNSMGGGYGINRNVSPENALTVAEPAMKGVSIKPGHPTLVPRRMPHTPSRKK